MFDALCALLLRLYPAGFRREYGREAARLLRDRARDERGAVRRVRLLIDLAVDLAATRLRGWHAAPPAIARLDGAPRFDIIEIEGPRPRTLVAGTLTSLLLFASFILLFQPTSLPTVPAPLGEGGSGSESPGGDSNDFSVPSVVPDPQARHKLVAAIAANLQQFYVDRAAGRELADALLKADTKGQYEELDLGDDLAARLNRDIQTTARALGIPRGVFVADIVFSAQPLPTGPPPPMTPELRERNRAAMLQQNCLVETVDRLPHNIGYLKLNGFAEATACHEVTGRTMTSLNTADAVIIDLRENGGGFGETALQIAGYFFGRPTYMYDPRPDSPVSTRTSSPVAGNNLADKTVYVLTSSRTQSAAEYFAYNLKMLKRATLVGETTAGHQHSGAFRRVNDHFGMGIQESARPDNPYPVKGWEVIGVEPDVRTSRPEALRVARELAERRQSTR